MPTTSASTRAHCGNASAGLRLLRLERFGGGCGPNVTAAGILDGLARSLKGQERLIILAHDSHDKYQTAAALPQIIALLQHKGYSFDRLDSRVAPIVFAYPRPSLDRV